MADIQRAQDLIAESKDLERRSGKERRGVGEKMPCPNCGYAVSCVVNRSITQKAEGAYIRYRQCEGCWAVFETHERVTGTIVKLPKPA